MDQKRKKKGREGSGIEEKSSKRNPYDPDLHMIQFATKFLLTQLYAHTADDRESLLLWISRLKYSMRTTKMLHVGY